MTTATTAELADRLKDEIYKRQQVEARLETALEALKFAQRVQASCEKTMGELRSHVSKLAEGRPLHECDGHPDADDVIEGLQADKLELQARVAELQQVNAQLANEAAEYAKRAGDLDQQLAAERKESAGSRESLARISAAHTDGVNRWRSEHPGRAMQMPLTRAELVGWLLSKLAARSEEIRVVFDGPPGPAGGRFVEVEAPSGRSISVGEWAARDGGMWELRIARAIPSDVDEKAIDEACALLRPVSGVAGSDMDALIASARSVADLQKKWQKTEAKLQSIRDRQRSIIDHRGQVEIVDIDGKTCGHGHWEEVDGRFVLRVAKRYVEQPSAEPAP